MAYNSGYKVGEGKFENFVGRYIFFAVLASSLLVIRSGVFFCVQGWVKPAGSSLWGAASMRLIWECPPRRMVSHP